LRPRPAAALLLLPVLSGDAGRAGPGRRAAAHPLPAVVDAAHRMDAGGDSRDAALDAPEVPAGVGRPGRHGRGACHTRDGGPALAPRSRPPPGCDVLPDGPLQLRRDGQRAARRVVPGLGTGRSLVGAYGTGPDRTRLGRPVRPGTVRARVRGGPGRDPP